MLPPEPLILDMVQTFMAVLEVVQLALEEYMAEEWEEDLEDMAAVLTADLAVALTEVVRHSLARGLEESDLELVDSGLVDTVADVSVLMVTSAHGVRGMLETVAANGRSVRSAVGGAIRRDFVRGN